MFIFYFEEYAFTVQTNFKVAFLRTMVLYFNRDIRNQRKVRGKKL